MVYVHIYIFVDKLEFNIFRNFSNNKNTIKKNEIVFPSCYSIGEKLNYIRNLTNIFVDKYNINYFKVEINNILENKKIDEECIDSIKMEGVLDELFQSKGVKLWK